MSLSPIEVVPLMCRIKYNYIRPWNSEGAAAVSNAVPKVAVPNKSKGGERYGAWIRVVPESCHTASLVHVFLKFTVYY